MSLLEISLRSLAALAAVLVLPLAAGQTEHKVMAHMQGRLGPMYAGGFHGWAQLVADGVKFVQKEDITPAAADRAVFRLAPAVALVPYLIAIALLPVHPGVAAAEVPGSLLLVLAVTGRSDDQVADPSEDADPHELAAADARFPRAELGAAVRHLATQPQPVLHGSHRHDDREERR